MPHHVKTPFSKPRRAHRTQLAVLTLAVLTMLTWPFTIGLYTHYLTGVGREFSDTDLALRPRHRLSLDVGEPHVPLHVPSHVPPPRNRATCLTHVVYDKPIKTGSSALSRAIRNRLSTLGVTWERCPPHGPDSCRQRALQICNGTLPKAQWPSLVGHLLSQDGEEIRCLKKLGFYAVTSVREPYARRRSSFLYNRMKNESYNNISSDLSFSEYMSRLPRCVLHNYHDRRGLECEIGGISVEDRVRRIAERYDEVIDLYGDQVVGPLHKKVVPFLLSANKSLRPKSEFEEEFDRDTLKEELVLYRALRAKIGQRVPPERMPC